MWMWHQVTVPHLPDVLSGKDSAVTFSWMKSNSWTLHINSLSSAWPVITDDILVDFLSFRCPRLMGCQPLLILFYLLLLTCSLQELDSKSHTPNSALLYSALVSAPTLTTFLLLWNFCCIFDHLHSHHFRCSSVTAKLEHKFDDRDSILCLPVDTVLIINTMLDLIIRNEWINKIKI